MPKASISLETLERALLAGEKRASAEALLACYREAVPGDHFSAILLDGKTFATEAYLEGEGWLAKGHPFAGAARGEFGVHPAVAKLIERPEPTVLPRSRLLSDSRWRRSEFYNEVDRPYGVEDTVTIYLQAPGDTAMFLTCARGRNFPDRDLQTVESLLRILCRLGASRDTGRTAARVNALGANLKPAPMTLTAREREVLHWVREGKRNAEIAAILGISPHTVHHHLEKIFAKLGVETRAAAARCV